MFLAGNEKGIIGCIAIIQMFMYACTKLCSELRSGDLAQHYSGNGLMHDGTKSLSGPVLTNHQRIRLVMLHCRFSQTNLSRNKLSISIQSYWNNRSVCNKQDILSIDEIKRPFGSFQSSILVNALLFHHNHDKMHAMHSLMKTCNYFVVLYIC